MLDDMPPQLTDKLLVEDLQSVLDQVYYSPKTSARLSGMSDAYFLPVFNSLGLRSTDFSLAKAYSIEALA